MEPDQAIRSKSLWRFYINIIIVSLYIIYRLDFVLKLNVSGTHWSMKSTSSNPRSRKLFRVYCYNSVCISHFPHATYIFIENWKLKMQTLSFSCYFPFWHPNILLCFWFSGILWRHSSSYLKFPFLCTYVLCSNETRSRRRWWHSCVHTTQALDHELWNISGSLEQVLPVTDQLSWPLFRTGSTPSLRKFSVLVSFEQLSLLITNVVLIYIFMKIIIQLHYLMFLHQRTLALLTNLSLPFRAISTSFFTGILDIVKCWIKNKNGTSNWNLRYALTVLMII